MTPDPSEVLEALIARVMEAPPDAAMAMAKRYQDHLQNVTLRRYTHAPLTWTNSPAETGTPAWVTGNLERNIRTRPGLRTTFTAQASTGSYAIYARVQEEGAEIWHKTANWLHWVNIDPRIGLLTDWYRKFVKIPPRPYMKPALHDVMADGSLTESAAASFLATVWE